MEGEGRIARSRCLTTSAATVSLLAMKPSGVSQGQRWHCDRPPNSPLQLTRGRTLARRPQPPGSAPTCTAARRPHQVPTICAASAERRKDLPEGLTRIISRCLEKSAAARFPSARDVLSALSTVTSGATSEAPPASDAPTGRGAGIRHTPGGGAARLARGYHPARLGRANDHPTCRPTRRLQRTSCRPLLILAHGPRVARSR